MALILWILQAFFNASWMVLTKKVVENKIVWNNLQTFFSRSYHLIILSILFLFWVFNYNQTQANLENIDYFLLLLGSIWIYITYPLRRIAYANEKVSVLQPYAMLFQIFPVIIGFIFIASERANIITFLSALLASIVVIAINIDYKTFKFNKYSLMVLFSSIIKSFQIFVVIHLLTKLNPASFYFMESIIILFFSILLMILQKDLSQIKLLTKKYMKLLMFTNTVVITSILFALTMYSSLWVVLTSLLSLLYLVFIYTLSYFILKEIPKKKDVLVTIFISLCIIVWVIFKS